MNTEKCVYLDHNGSSPVAEEVLKAMRPWFESCIGNPKSSHQYGRKGHQAIEEARAKIAKLIDCKTEELVFTSGGTESNNLALKGIADNLKKGHIVTSAIEHSSVLATCRYLETQGFELSVVPVNAEGFVELDSLRDAVRPDTALVSIMLGNNEVGSLQAISEISRIVRQSGAVFHCDAAQVVGKHEVSVEELDVDLLTIAGHKFNAPKGVGALYIRTGTQLQSQMIGAGHERGLRSGTMDVCEIVGLGAAAERFTQLGAQITNGYRELRDYFENRVLTEIPGASRNGPSRERLANTSNLAFEGIKSGDLLASCPEIAVSAGASCHKDHTTPSHVLSAMGLPLERIESSIRVSLGYASNREDLGYAVDALARAVKSLRS